MAHRRAHRAARKSCALGGVEPGRKPSSSRTDRRGADRRLGIQRCDAVPERGGHAWPLREERTRVSGPARGTRRDRHRRQRFHGWFAVLGRARRCAGRSRRRSWLRSALFHGCTAARGRYIIIGDSDGSYDFSRLDAFVSSLRRGADFVIGNRFAGGIAPGAMPWKNRYIGTRSSRSSAGCSFDRRVTDFNCGCVDSASQHSFAWTCRQSWNGVRFRYDRQGHPLACESKSERRHCRATDVFESPSCALVRRVASPAIHAALQSSLAVLLSGYRAHDRRFPRRRPAATRADCDCGRVSASTCTHCCSRLRSCSWASKRIFFLLSVCASVCVLARAPAATRGGAQTRALAFESVPGSWSECRSGSTTPWPGRVTSALTSWAAVGFGSLDPRTMLRTAIPSVTAICLGAQIVMQFSPQPSAAASSVECVTQRARSLPVLAIYTAACLRGIGGIHYAHRQEGPLVAR